MPIKVTYTTTRQHTEHQAFIDTHPEEYAQIEDWTRSFPGWMDSFGVWLVPSLVSERSYIFNNQENANAFVEARRQHPVQIQRKKWSTDNGITTTVSITEV
jgi:hypothetical protein